ncbi:SAUR-like auxin-responsive protein family [Striga hermonthica]|uniref:SAUR-like auxin-responsive protein family n=1 Tax=Striga hermonthica TaxID=68872 RepID=A0A9N7R731_STRHE|nr:SAUR-like auxin-responsive protein family [Striga hermonthica]
MGRSSILKKLERYLMMSNGKSGNSSKMLVKSRSWPNKKTKIMTTPNGCFSVYVGPTRQRFVIKTESANHPLFRTLLQDAELEYGFKNEGPLLLPCDVDLFCSVLAEMDDGDDHHQDVCGPTYACASPFLARSRTSYAHLSINTSYQ